MPLTRLEFRSRFTAVEKATIELAGADNPSAPLAQRQQAAAIRSYMADVEQSQYIDVTRAGTIAGVQALEAVGLIAPGRAARILAPAPGDAIASGGALVLSDGHRIAGTQYCVASSGSYGADSLVPCYMYGDPDKTVAVQYPASHITI